MANKKEVSPPPAGKSKRPAARKPPATARLKSPFPIVGIGASAGGLEALEAFFTAVPIDTGNAFVLVSHLDPNHISILPELIQKKTGMKTCQATDGMKVFPNQVYLIPPNKKMAILNGSLQLFELSQPRRSNLPIDSFLRSLALDQGEMAVAIILSGTGTDGTLGVRAIKGESGMVMVQDAESAKFDGMPTSAISTGLVDYILPPDKMPEQLVKFACHQAKRKTSTGAAAEEMLSALPKIFVLLRAKTGHDFSLYKKNTLCRRIERRMYVHQIDKIANYVRFLQESEQEITILFRELLIGVTSFFRDTEAFALLRDVHLPKLLRHKEDDSPIRIWVPGCSSGEEAYSIAIIMQEAMDELQLHFIVQIFATDLDDNAIDVARAGNYPVSIAADIDPTRLQKFFSKNDDQYQIKKFIREMVIFASQNLIKDPPFTKLDMLSCRNLLIYFGPELQKKLLPIFHYSLREDGILFLGSSETVSQATDLFFPLDKKWKIFKRQPAEQATTPILEFPTMTPNIEQPEKDTLAPIKPFKDISTIKLLRAILTQSNIPACVVIDDAANLLYVHGRTGRFLEPAEGVTSINVLEMTRPGLKVALTNAIRKVASDRHEVCIKGLQVKDSFGAVNLTLIVRPLPDLQSGQRGMMMVIFDEVTGQEVEQALAKKTGKPVKKNNDIKRLENELQYTRENLQSTIEELETSNEELKSTNEELQSTNEELQSTNEELETSKEELQSLNEESTTINSELQGRIDELVAANDDIKNLLAATQIATIFLDIDLNIRRFTPQTRDFFHLTLTDIGRPIEHFASTLQGIKLKDCAAQVLNDLGQYEQEVTDEQGQIYRMRIRPYRTLNNVIEGVVVTFENITEYKIVQKALNETEEKWRGLVENAPMFIAIVANKQFVYVNPFGIDLFGGTTQGQFLETKQLDVISEDFQGLVNQRINTLFIDRKPIRSVKEKITRIDGKTIELILSAAPIDYKGELGALVFAWEKP